MNMFNREILEGLDIIPAFMPVDMSAGANAGDRVGMDNCDRLLFILLASVGTAGDDPVISAQQHTAASGGSSKALNFTRYWSKVGATAINAVGQFSRATQAASDSLDTAALDGAENQAMICIEVMAEDLDADNGFTHVSFDVADVGTNAQLGAGLYILSGLGYAITDIPSSID